MHEIATNTGKTETNDDTILRFQSFMATTPSDATQLVAEKYTLMLQAACDTEMRCSCAGSLHLLVFLLNHFNSKRQVAWPSNHRIQTNIGFDKKSLRKARNTLIKFDYIAYIPGGGRIANGGHRSCSYTFNFAKSRTFSLLRTEDALTQLEAKGASKGTPTGGECAPLRGANGTPESINKPKYKPNKYAARACSKNVRSSKRGFKEIGDQGEPWIAFSSTLARYGNLSSDAACQIIMELPSATYDDLVKKYQARSLSIDHLLSNLSNDRVGI